MTPYPSAQEYIEAVQRPGAAFQLPELRHATFETHPILGIPMPASGNSAVVFKALVNGSPAALRFFIREDASSRERYTALGRFFVDHDIESVVAQANWVDDAISVKDGTWPMVRMDWVDGRTLDTYVDLLASSRNAGALMSLAGTWRALLQRLQGAGFAHGDLQHGNVFVDTTSSLRLVDFDGAWIDAFSGGPPPNETGHPNYQRTGREWGRWMDTFPGLVVYTALITLARRPDAWSQLQTGENLLFSADDFRPPFTTAAWQLVGSVPDAEVQQAAELLKQACTPGWRADDTLESVLAQRPRSVIDPPPADGPAKPYAGVSIPHHATTVWWEQPVAPPVPGAMPPPPSKSGSGAPAGPPHSFTGPVAGWYPPARSSSESGPPAGCGPATLAAPSVPAAPAAAPPRAGGGGDDRGRRRPGGQRDPGHRSEQHGRSTARRRGSGRADVPAGAAEAIARRRSFV